MNFFGLSSDYGKYLIDEFKFLAKMINLSYSDFLKMPTYMRKYLVDSTIEDNTPNN
jgi:hypothetical protein